jgi:hypothetical protein
MKDKYSTHFDEYKKEQLLSSFKGPKSANTQRIDLSSTNALANSKLANSASVGARISIEQLESAHARVSSLPDSHIAKKYMLGRKFTNEQMERLFYTDNFKHTASLINKETTDRLPEDKRIVIPFVNVKGEVEMIQGRALEESYIRYASVKADEDVTKIYGQYDIDPTETVYCTEGPFDAILLGNCLATCDANLTRADADVYIWDAQPRNKDVIRYMSEAIDKGCKVVIWPFSIDSKLDINDMIKKGLTSSDILGIVKKHTYSGLTAKLKLAEWKRV